MFGGVADLFLDHEVSIARAADSMVRVVEGERVVTDGGQGARASLDRRRDASRPRPGASSGRPGARLARVRIVHRAPRRASGAAGSARRRPRLGAGRRDRSARGSRVGDGADRAPRGHGRDGGRGSRRARARRSDDQRAAAQARAGLRSRARCRDGRAPRGARVAGRRGAERKRQTRVCDAFRSSRPALPARRRRSACAPSTTSAPRRRSGRSGASWQLAQGLLRRAFGASPPPLLLSAPSRRLRPQGEAGGQSGVAGRGQSIGAGQPARSVASRPPPRSWRSAPPRSSTATRRCASNSWRSARTEPALPRPGIRSPRGRERPAACLRSRRPGSPP